jgi:hypothetical protein
MSREKELALLADLVKMLRKHGADSFESLSELLRDPRFAEDLSMILKKTATAGRESGVLPKVTLASEILRLKQADPEKYELISGFQDRLKSGRILGTLKEMKNFAAMNGLQEPKSDSRPTAANSIIRSLLVLETERIRQALQEIKEAPESGGDLGQWSEIITRKMSRGSRPRSKD